MKLSWDNEKLIRGMAIEAKSEINDLNQIGPSLNVAWAKCLDVTDQLSEETKNSVLIEVWADTGRVIYRLSDAREFARVILCASRLEAVYYELPAEDDDVFDKAYVGLIERIRKEIESSVALGPRIDQIVIRDSDDETSQQNARI